MTSKEAFKELVEELKWCCNDGVELTEYDKHILEPIQKDLLMVQLIKPLIKVVENTKYTANPKYYLVLNDAVIAEEETMKFIKEWLENDN